MTLDPKRISTVNPLTLGDDQKHAEIFRVGCRECQPVDFQFRGYHAHEASPARVVALVYKIQGQNRINYVLRWECENLNQMIPPLEGKTIKISSYTPCPRGSAAWTTITDPCLEVGVEVEAPVVPL